MIKLVEGIFINFGVCSSGGEKYVLKYVSKETFDYFQDIYRQLEGCSCVRTLHDTIPEHYIFVFKFVREDLLSLAQKDLPLQVTKKILKDTLRGLAALHDLHIVHAGRSSRTRRRRKLEHADC